MCAYFLERELGCELGAGSLNECGHVVFHGKKRISQRKTEQLTLIANQSLALEGVECIASGAQTMFLIGLNSSNDATREESMKQIENVWGREKILEIYDKYFFDPDG